MLQSLNPATGELLRSFEPLTPEALESRLALAAAAAVSYPRVRLEQRAFWMRRLATLLESEADELAATMTAEMGKTLAAARAEVQKCALCCRYYAEHAAAILAEEPHANSNQDRSRRVESHVRYDPLGVVLAIMPWNFPLWQVFRFLAPALMAGNVGLLKHAPNVPQCALAIEAVVRRAGFPRGSFQALLIETAQVETVIADPRVAAITLTGGEAAGRAVAAQAGWFLKKTVLELGGADPFLVLPSADLSAAVAAAVQARCINNGQSCIAAKRFLIHESVYKEFERAFVAAMGFLRVGDPTDPATDVGPLATEATLRALVAQVEAAVAAGGRVLLGGRPLTRPGFFLPPTIVAEVPRDAAVARQETFGPLALLFPVSSLEDAITLANDTPFGLGASCWTRDPVEQQRLAERLECGGVFFNAIVASDPALPFGGIKRSGYGRELSAAGMREFLNAKTVVLSGPRPRDLQPSLFDEQELLDKQELLKAVQAAEEAARPRFVPRKPEPEPALARTSASAQEEEDVPEEELPPVRGPMRGSILGLSGGYASGRRAGTGAAVAPEAAADAVPASSEDSAAMEPVEAEIVADEKEREDLPPMRGSILGLPR